MNADAWSLLAERSRTLVHHASWLMGMLTTPSPDDDAMHRFAAANADHASAASQALLAAMVAAPELAAHQRTVQRFEAALAAWQRSVAETSPLARRYQTALMQHAAQLLITCLHVESLATSECARVQVTSYDIAGRMQPPAP